MHGGDLGIDSRKYIGKVKYNVKEQIKRKKHLQSLHVIIYQQNKILYINRVHTQNNMNTST